MSTTESKIAVITCTGDRAFAWKLCQCYHSRWTTPHTWIVIDGPNTPYDLNLYRAFRHLPKDVEKVVIMEDDDWYGPGHLGAAVAALDRVSVYGEAPDRWFNVRTPSYSYRGNTESAALASTAFRADLLPLFYDTMDAASARFLDMMFWREVKKRGIPHELSTNQNVVGVKGMLGRAGLGTGHAVPLENRDPAFLKLQEWIGTDFHHYRNLHAMMDGTVMT